HGSATIPSIRLTENEKVAEEIRDGMGVPTIRSGPKERRPLFAPDRVGCLEDSDHPIIQPDGEVPAGRGEGSSDRYTHAPEFELATLDRAGSPVPKANRAVHRCGGNPIPRGMITDSDDRHGMAGVGGLCFLCGDVPAK